MCLISNATSRDGHKVISAPQNACGNDLYLFFEQSDVTVTNHLAT